MTTGEAKQYLQDLDITDWEVKEVRKSGGQGTTLKVFNASSGEWGVFKMPKTGSAKELERFEREIDILAEISNRNVGIVPLLAQSRHGESLWYISKLGTPFKEYWLRFREVHASEPELVLSTALAFMRHLLSGLAELHGRTDAILHRDIKPDNIVVIDDLPNFIDFGVGYWEGKERLTDIDDAVGNKRYSPDIMMNRIEDPTPWLDVYMMAQLFMWMLSEKPVKNWDRPVDFRFVHYQPEFDKHRLKIIAFTGACCEVSVGPINAREMLALLNRLFYESVAPPASNFQKILQTAESVEQKESELQASELEKKVRMTMKYEALRLLVTTNIKLINDLVEVFVGKLRSSGMSAEIERRKDDAVDRMFGFMNAQSATRSRWGEEIISVKITVAGTRSMHFGLTVNIDLDHVDRMDNPFYFSIVQLMRYERNVFMDRNGDLFNEAELKNPLQPAGVIELIKNFLEDPRSWDPY